jgi:hypothetical protein
MTTGNEAPDTGVTNDMLDGLLGAQVAAAQRRIAEERAREEWPANVNAILRALTDKVASQDTRIAALEARLG